MPRLTELELESFASDVREALKAAEILVVDGFAYERTGPLMVVPSGQTSAATVVSAISKLLPAFVTLNVELLTDEDIDEVRAEPEPEVGGGAGTVTARVALLEPNVGRVRAISISSVGAAPRAIVNFGWTAAWAFALERAEQTPRVRQSLPDKGVPEESVQALAREIAQSPKYQNAISASRAHAAKLVAGDRAASLSERDWWRVVRAAHDIFEVEVRPERDSAMRARAVQLLEDGKTKASIARELGLTPKQLTNLIG